MRNLIIKEIERMINESEFVFEINTMLKDVPDNCLLEIFYCVHGQFVLDGITKLKESKPINEKDISEKIYELKKLGINIKIKPDVPEPYGPIGR